MIFHVWYSLSFINMIIFTDDKRSAEKTLPVHQEWIPEDSSAIDHNLEPLKNKLYGDKPVYKTVSRISGLWRYAFFCQKRFLFPI